MHQACSFCIIQTPCMCSISTNNLYLPAKLATCQNNDMNITKYYPVNLALLHEFFKQDEYASIQGDTTFAQPISVIIPHFNIYNHSMASVIANDNKHYHIFTVKYVLFTYAIQAQVLCTYRDTISRKLYQFKICQNPYLPREIWTHITPPYHTPNLESCISSKFVKIHISLGRYGLISHPHITPQTSYHISRDPHIRSALFYLIVRCKLFSIYKSNFCI